jgi:hypothetical protein
MVITLSIIWKTSYLAASTTGDNFGEFKIGRAAWVACSGNLEFGNHLSICLKTEENQENLCKPRKLVKIILKSSVRNSKRIPHFTITNINWLMLFKETIAVYSENRTETHKC